MIIYSVYGEKDEVSNSDVLKDITPQNEIQMWQCLKLCILLSLARQGYGRAAAVPACCLSSSLRRGRNSNCFACFLTWYEPKQTDKFP